MIALVAVLLLAAGLAQTGLGHAALSWAGLSRSSGNFTSLAFQNAQPVPAALKGSSPVPVTFVIQNNDGGASSTYQWSVSVVSAGQARKVAAGAVTVAGGHAIELTQQARVSCTAAGPVRLVVSLVQPAESIDAWTACPAPRK
jgi:hypothetical protein